MIFTKLYSKYNHLKKFRNERIFTVKISKYQFYYFTNFKFELLNT